MKQKLFPDVQNRLKRVINEYSRSERCVHSNMNIKLKGYLDIAIGRQMLLKQKTGLYFQSLWSENSNFQIRSLTWMSHSYNLRNEVFYHQTHWNAEEPNRNSASKTVSMVDIWWSGWPYNPGQSFWSAVQLCSGVKLPATADPARVTYNYVGHLGLSSTLPGLFRARTSRCSHFCNETKNRNPLYLSAYFCFSIEWNTNK